MPGKKFQWFRNRRIVFPNADWYQTHGLSIARRRAFEKTKKRTAKRQQRDNLGGRCATCSRRHDLKCVLNSLLVWTLNLDIDDPETSHIKCLMLVEGCRVDRIAACDKCVTCSHIHDQAFN